MAELALYPPIIKYFRQNILTAANDEIYDVSQKYLNDFISKTGISTELDQSSATWQIKVDLFYTWTRNKKKRSLD